MCTGGQSSSQRRNEAEQRRLVEQQNRQNQENFERSQGLAVEQFDFQRDQANIAQAEENARRGRVFNAVTRINQAKDTRDPIYQQLEDATFDINRDRLIESRGDSGLGLKHALQRGGLLGSSVDIERNQDIQDRFNQGLVDSRNTAQTAANNARAADAQIFGSLINSASTGNFSGSDLLNSASGALTATANTSPVIVPQFANDTFFSDIVGGLGNIAFQAGNAIQQNRNSGSRSGNSSNSGTIRGGS